MSERPQQGPEFYSAQMKSPLEAELPHEVSPEIGAINRMWKATTVFLSDLGAANYVAKSELKETASSRVGKALAVTTAGGVLEMVSGVALGRALDTIKGVRGLDISRLTSLLNNGTVQEMLEGVAVYGAYSWGNKFVGDVLPKVPASYIGAAVGVDLGEAAVRNVLRKPKQPEWQFVQQGGETSKEFDLKFEQQKQGAAAKVANFANPVTLYGVSQIIEGVGAYGRALGEVRQARTTKGQEGVRKLLVAAAKAEKEATREEEYKKRREERQKRYDKS